MLLEKAVSDALYDYWPGIHQEKPLELRLTAGFLALVFTFGIIRVALKLINAPPSEEEPSSLLQVPSGVTGMCNTFAEALYAQAMTPRGSPKLPGRRLSPVQ